MGHRLDVRLRQPVVPPQARPAVGPVDELGDEPAPQPGVRGPGQVGDLRDARRRGHVLAHPEGVVVAEPERPAEADAVGRQCRGEVRRVGLEDLPGDGAGVLGVGVDVALRQRQPQRGGAAEVVAAGRGPGVAGELGAHLRQDHRLGELLRPDRHGLVRRPATPGQEDKETR